MMLIRKIASFVPDVQLDGVDANCDGVDDQYLCSDGTYDCLNKDDYTVCKGGADLVPVYGQVVAGCVDNEDYFVIGNHGDNTYEGRVLVTYLESLSSDYKDKVFEKQPDFEVEVALEPGQLVAIQIYYNVKELSIEQLDAGDCDPDNNKLSMLLISASCTQ